MFGIINTVIRQSIFILGNCHLFGSGCTVIPHSRDMDLIEPLTNGALSMAQVTGLARFFHGLADLFICGLVLLVIAFLLGRLSESQKGRTTKGIIALSMVLFGFAYALLLPFALVALLAYCSFHLLMRVFALTRGKAVLPTEPFKLILSDSASSGSAQGKRH